MPPNETPKGPLFPSGENEYQRRTGWMEETIGSIRESNPTKEQFANKEFMKTWQRDIKRPDLVQYWKKNAYGKFAFDEEGYYRDQRFEQYREASNRFVENIQRVDEYTLKLRQDIERKATESREGSRAREYYAALEKELRTAHDDCLRKIAYIRDVADPDYGRTKPKELLDDYSWSNITTDSKNKQKRYEIPTETEAEQERRKMLVSLRLRHPRAGGRVLTGAEKWEELVRLGLSERNKLVHDLSDIVNDVQKRFNDTRQINIREQADIVEGKVRFQKLQQSKKNREEAARCIEGIGSLLSAPDTRTTVMENAYKDAVRAALSLNTAERNFRIQDAQKGPDAQADLYELHKERVNILRNARSIFPGDDKLRTALEQAVEAQVAFITAKIGDSTWTGVPQAELFGLLKEQKEMLHQHELERTEEQEKAKREADASAKPELPTAAPPAPLEFKNDIALQFPLRTDIQRVELSEQARKMYDKTPTSANGSRYWKALKMELEYYQEMKNLKEQKIVEQQMKQLLRKGILNETSIGVRFLEMVKRETPLADIRADIQATVKSLEKMMKHAWSKELPSAEIADAAKVCDALKKYLL